MGKSQLLIKAYRYRTQERNKQDALTRLIDILTNATAPIKPRKETKPTYGSKQRRLAKKKNDGKIKSLRQNKWDKEH